MSRAQPSFRPDIEGLRGVAILLVVLFHAGVPGLAGGFVDMNDQICAAAVCGVTRNGVVVFTDDNHLTASFSRSVAPVLGARLAAASGLAALASTARR